MVVTRNVHNHGPAEGPGLDCPERLTGRCMEVPNLGVLANIDRVELVALTSALGLDPAYVGSITITADLITIHEFDPKTTAVNSRAIGVVDSWDLADDDGEFLQGP